MLNEPPRIQPTDALFSLFDDLCAQAQVVRPWDADRREAWMAACVDVLAVVPDYEQRVAWAISLSMRLSVVGQPIQCVVQLLLARVEEAQRCRR